MEYFQCPICKKTKLYDRKKGHRLTKCGSCQVNHRRFKVKQKLVEYKGGKCIKCGYDKCIQALQFHHRNSNEKDFTIGGKHCMAFEKIQKEVDKCDLLCANCHAEFHSKRDIK